MFQGNKIGKGDYSKRKEYVPKGIISEKWNTLKGKNMFLRDQMLKRGQPKRKEYVPERSKFEKGSTRM